MTAESSSYDQIPYNSFAFPQTHPDRLATVARLFGLASPNVAACRVLELGSASGGNLIPMAFNLPDSEFVGIDLSRHQAEEGQATVRAMGLSNVRIEQASILDVSPDWGTFDFVICHGVYSWVPPEVQEKILHIARENLSPDGLAYVSYNTYPGWHMREMVRHMMRYHVAQFDEPREQIDQARALLEFMASASQGSGPYGDLLGREVERLSRSSNSYLFHEHLEPTNSPIYFHEFVERAERAGLLYLSEASVSDMLTSHFPRHVAETLERISPDLLHLEQYLDFVRNRQFRQSLLCHAGRKPNRALSPASLAGLLVSSRALPEGGDVNLTDGVAVGFSNGKQRATATRPASKAAFALLTEHWPRALAVDALCDLAMARATPFLDGASGDSRDAMLGDLFGGVVYGMVETHTQPPRCTASPSERPGALPFAFHQSQQNSFVVNAHHDTCLLEGMALEVLKLCDGRRSRGDIVNELVGRHQNGTLQIDVDGRVVVSPDEARTVIGDRVQRALVSLTRDALLLQ